MTVYCYLDDVKDEDGGALYSRARGRARRWRPWRRWRQRGGGGGGCGGGGAVAAVAADGGWRRGRGGRGGAPCWRRGAPRPERPGGARAPRDPAGGAVASFVGALSLANRAPYGSGLGLRLRRSRGTATVGFCGA